MLTRINSAVTFSLVAANMGAPVLRMWNPLDPVGSFFADLAEALREWYASMLQWIVDVVTMVSVPPPDMLVNVLFAQALGGTYGFARILVALIAVIVAFAIVLTPTARHGVKIQRTLTSMLMVLVLGWIFFPLYSLAYNVSKALVEGALALIRTEGETPVEAIMRLFTTVNVTDSINTIISTGISGVFGILLIGSAYGLFLATLFVLIFYPLAVAIRPLGKFGNTVFNVCNALLVTTLLSPAIIAVTFLFPLYAQTYMSAVSIVASPFFAILGSLFAVVTPFVIFFMAFKKSSEVFGRLDDASGRFDIGQMPPVSVEEVKQDIKTTNNTSITTALADVVTDSLLYGGGSKNVFDDMLKGGIDAAATAATAAGHPYAGAAFKAAGGMYSRARQKAREESSDNQTTEGGEK